MSATRLHPLRKLTLAMRVWRSFLRVRLALHRRPLPDLVMDLTRRSPGRRSELPPRRLGLAVHKALTVGSLTPRCLISSLVLYDLLHDEGEAATLVIGLPDSPSTKDAHAWVEVDGIDVGPPPGRGTHRELARYGP